MAFAHLPRRLLRLIKRPPQLAYALGFGPLIGRLVLLLTTTGRKSGLPRVTPLQYEEQDGTIYIGSSRGTQADWYRNIVADPHVKVQIKSRRFASLAETTTDCQQIVDYLELRLKRHPVMMRFMLRADGLPPQPSRAQLAQYATRLALVIIRPDVSRK